MGEEHDERDRAAHAEAPRNRAHRDVVAVPPHGRRDGDGQHQLPADEEHEPDDVQEADCRPHAGSGSQPPRARSVGSAGEVVQVLRLGAHRVQRAPHGHSPRRRPLPGGRRDAVLAEPARQVLPGHLAARPPERRALGLAAASQAAAVAADEQVAVENRLADVGYVLRRGVRSPRPRAGPDGWRARRTSRGGDAVAGRPGPVGAVHARVVAATCRRSWASRRSRPGSRSLPVTAGIVIGAGLAQQLVKVIGDRVTAIVGGAAGSVLASNTGTGTGMVVAASGLLLLSSASVDASYASDILPGLIPQSVAWGSRSCRSR
jgi:hypothetical protein